MTHRKLTAAILVLSAVLLTSELSAEDRIATTPNGTLDTSLYAGKVVYVDFWASWCKPCQASFAWMNKMHDRYGDHGLVIIAINVDHNPENAQGFLKITAPRFKVVYDTAAAMAKAYDLEGLPCSFVYDTRGKLISTHVGFRERDQDNMENTLRSLLP